MIDEGDSSFGITWGGVVTVDSTVNPGTLYRNSVPGHALYGNYVYIDPTEYPTPVAYSATDGGQVNNGLFGVSDRTSGDQKTAVGYRAGYRSTGENGVFVGIQAGQDADISSSTFDSGYSVGVGRLALHDSTGASSTVAIGAETGNHLNGGRGVWVGSYSGNTTTSEESVGIGWRAGEQATGNNKVSIGKQSGYQSNGANQTAVGYHAGLGSDGDSQVAVGDYSLGNATTASDFNVAIGSRVLENSNAINNTAVGYQAAYRGDSSAIDSSNLTLMGYRAGYGVGVGTGNTGFGRQACEGLTGTYNSSLGYLANRNHAFSRTTAIGQASTVTGNDQIQLGTTGTTTYAYGAVQDRSDRRDKIDIKSLTDDHIAFFMDIEWRQYRMDYRESYADTDADGTVTAVDKDGSRSGSRYHIGAIAQQVEEAMLRHNVDFAGLQHHSVNGGEDVYTIGYQEFIGIQGEIIQRQAKDIASIKEHLGI
jgi:hypothetical protein